HFGLLLSALLFLFVFLHQGSQLLSRDLLIGFQTLTHLCLHPAGIVLNSFCPVPLDFLIDDFYRLGLHIHLGIERNGVVAQRSQVIILKLEAEYLSVDGKVKRHGKPHLVLYRCIHRIDSDVDPEFGGRYIDAVYAPGILANRVWTLDPVASPRTASDANSDYFAVVVAKGRQVLETVVGERRW